MTRSRIIMLTLVCVLINIFIISPLMLAQSTFGSIDRAFRADIGIDQTGNALLGGSEDETISSRAARAKDGRQMLGAGARGFYRCNFRQRPLQSGNRRVEFLAVDG